MPRKPAPAERQRETFFASKANRRRANQLFDEMVELRGVSDTEVEWARMFYWEAYLNQGRREDITIAVWKEWRKKYPFPEDPFRLWFVLVLALDIHLHPGGVALIVHEPIGVTIEWKWNKAHVPGITAFHIVNDLGLEMGQIDANPYLCALYLHLRKEPPPPEPDAQLPAPGKPASISFYRNLIAEYGELIKEAEPAPVKRLAEKYGQKPGTVKVWLHRGRGYLKRWEEQSGKD